MGNPIVEKSQNGNGKDSKEVFGGIDGSPAISALR
jgi:hypothetical protein